MLIWLCIAWVFCSVGVALLPLRFQYVPAVVLLLAAPVLIVMIALQIGWMIAGLALAAFVSMFRHPLRFLLGKLLKTDPQVPQ